MVSRFFRIHTLLQFGAPLVDRNRESVYRIQGIEVIHPQNNFVNDGWDERSSSPRDFIVLAEIDRDARSPDSKHAFQSLYLDHSSRHRLLLSFHGDETTVHLSLDESELDAEGEEVDIWRGAESHRVVEHLRGHLDIHFVIILCWRLPSSQAVFFVDEICSPEDSLPLLDLPRG